MRNRTSAAVFCVWFLTLSWQSATIIRADEKRPESAAAEQPPDLSMFPKLRGKVVQVLGNPGSFVLPQAGQTFELELKDALKLQKLTFGDGSWVSLPGPIVVDIRKHSNGAFANMRLVSKEGRNKVTIEFVPKPGSGNPRRVFVWVVGEGDVIRGVALIDCESDTPFPGRK
jgi:hypothetical protein